jgi:hypothetical protein
MKIIKYITSALRLAFCNYNLSNTATVNCHLVTQAPALRDLKVVMRVSQH